MNSSLFDALLQSMRDRFPKLSWKLGSVIRTLLLEPLVSISDEITKYSDKLANISNIKASLDDPQNHEAELDYWIKMLGIPLPEASPATGTIVLKTSSNKPLTVASGTRFSWDDSVTVYASKRYDLGVDQPFIELAPGVYTAEIGVTSGAYGTAYLKSGTPLNWETAPDSVKDIYVKSPIGGGVVIDAKLKAEVIKSTLTAPTICGADSIRSALISRYPGVICDAYVGGKKTSSSRCIVPLYIKQSYPPTSDLTDIPEASVDVNTAKGCIAIRINTEGALQVLEVGTAGGVPVVADRRTQIGVIGDSGSYLEIETSQFGASDYLKSKLTFQARVLRYPAALAAIAWLNDSQRGLPYMVHGEAPAYAELKLQIDTEGADIPVAAKEEICEYINKTQLNETITDTAVVNILEKYGVSVSSAILYIANVTYLEDHFSIRQTGSMSLFGRLGLGETPIAAYCYVNDIESY